jgi:rod shape-determining protein MreD
MLVNNLYKVGWFVGLTLLQVLILNNVHIGGVATPFLYIYMLLKFDTETSRNTLLLWAFFLGLAVDIFSDTLGVNVVASVTMAFFLPFFLRLFVPRDSLDNLTPSIKSLGIFPFLRYALLCVLVHHTTLFLVEFFSFAHLGLLLLRILFSTLLTLACVLSIEGLRRR